MLKKLLHRLAGVNPELHVGIMETATTVNGEKVAQYAYWNEYGTDDGRIPPRPFMRQTFEKNVGKWKHELARQMKADPESIIAAFEYVGDIAVADMNEMIEKSGIFEPNAASTIARKGADKPPLVDTGTMEEVITFEVKS